MSQDFHQAGVYNFSISGYERSPSMKQQAAGDWISPRGFELQDEQVQVEVSGGGGPQVIYDTVGTGGGGSGGGMLTEMMMMDGFPRQAGRKQPVVNHRHHHILDGHIHQSSYNRWSQKQPLALTINEAVLPLMNPQNIKVSSSSSSYQVDHSNPSQFSWIISQGNEVVVDDPIINSKICRTIDQGQGLSLSLSSSLPTTLEPAKFQELRIGGDGGGMRFYDNIQGPSLNYYGLKNHHQDPSTDYQIHFGHPASSSSSRLGNVLRNSKYLRPAQELLEEFCCVGRGQFFKKVKGQSTGNPKSISPGDGVGGGGDGGAGSPAVSLTSSKDRQAPLTAYEKHDLQRKKVKLLSMLDEVDARYTHYCEQMQAIVSSFDSVIGYGAAAPYTNLAQKAMSRHFRSIKDAIFAQLKATCEALGDKEVAGTLGLTKGETPRLKMLEQKFRQQKAFHQLGMLDPETWRPQRGLPERSVNILRAWLFEHFLHPYPTDADKHLLSRQTGLSKNQVSNWFINARVRLWKPMIEDIYKEEIKEEGDQEDDEQPTTLKNNQNKDHLGKSDEDNNNDDDNVDDKNDESDHHQDHHSQRERQNIDSSAAQTPKPTMLSSPSSEGLIRRSRSEINAAERDPSKNIISNHGQYYNSTITLENQAILLQGTPTTTTVSASSDHHHNLLLHHHHQYQHQHQHNVGDHQTMLQMYGCLMGNMNSHEAPVGMMNGGGEYGAQAGDVSLTLGLRHSTNVPRKSTPHEFSIRDFGAF